MTPAVLAGAAAGPLLAPVPPPDTPPADPSPAALPTRPEPWLARASRGRPWVLHAVGVLCSACAGLAVAEAAWDRPRLAVVLAFTAALLLDALRRAEATALRAQVAAALYVARVLERDLRVLERRSDSPGPEPDPVAGEP